MAQLLARRTIDREVESSNQASDREKCRRVAKGRGPLVANSTSSTEMRHPIALSLPTLILVGIGEISISLGIDVLKVTSPSNAPIPAHTYRCLYFLHKTLAIKRLYLSRAEM